jgi:S-DNA-T family DNA segregation ATPase FtsK/SpoIIIE
MPILFMRKKKKTEEKRSSAEPADRWTLREIFTGKRRSEVRGIAWWFASLLLIAALWPHASGQNALGPSGEILFRLGFGLLGVMVYSLPLLALAYGWLVFHNEQLEHKSLKTLGAVLGGLALGVLIELAYPEKIHLALVKPFYAWQGAEGFWASMPGFLRLWNEHFFAAGGSVAGSVCRLLVTVFSTAGTYIICGAILIISFYLLEVEHYLAGLFRRVFEKVRAGVNDGAEAAAQFGYAAPKEAAPAAKSKKEPKPSAAPVIAAAVTAAEPERPRIKINVPVSSATMAKEPAAPKPPASPAAVTVAGDTTLGPAFVLSEEKHYDLPGLSLLNDPKPTPGFTAGYFEKMSTTLETTLGQFGVAAKVVEVCPGPVVTRYELQPSPGVKVNRILSLADDIAMAMKAEHVRMEAPIPGKGAVGIEIPNQEKQVVVLKELLAADEFQNAESVLTFAVGKDIGGKYIYARLDSMPHLLIAGATGSGKSACINGIISSLLYRAKPDQVKFVMIDPKRVELTTYNGIPHLKSPVITDCREAAVALRFLVKEMEDRYRRLADLGVRDIASFNRKVAEERVEKADGASGKLVLTSMPYILIFIDELADLMMVAASEVETAIARLAQMARGVGMHMILATQRPSVDVITGIIKANFPSRIAFQVSSKVDSRTILDANGADALLGRGDMLYAPASANKPLRVQGVFITTEEVNQVVDFWRKQGAPVFDAAYAGEKLQAANNAGQDSEEEDELYEEAMAWIIRAKQASTSMLQRRLKVGYSRAARLLDLMERRGIVGPPDGSKPRKVLIDGSGDEYANGEEAVE